MKLTKAEAAWIAKVQKVLNECPSNRLAGYTVGDNDVALYDRRDDERILDIQNDSSMDYSEAVNKVSTHLGSLFFPFQVHSVSG